MSPRRVARAWSLDPRDPAPALALRQELGVSERLALLLAARELSGAEAAAFLEPGWSQLLDPFLLAGMQEACDEVHAAIARGETITLYGDYDVDGTAATAVLYWVIRKLRGKVRTQIPDRHGEGYGLTEAGLRQVRDAGSRLVITVDQGVSAHREVEQAREMGIRVIVTDHHALGETLPDAVAVLHPRRPGQEYPNGDLCGAAVGFKLGEALLQTAPNAALRESVRRYQESSLELVALATIADMTPLRGENRALVALGLERMGRSRHPGIRAMLAEAGRGEGPVEADDVGFGVAPMMNAAGRLADAGIALDCLLARDPGSARRYARRLGELNRKRRTLTEELTTLALARREEWSREAIGVLDLDSDQVGIVGLVAGRLKERFWKPFVVCARRGEELVGSCRSIEGFDVKQALDAVGGHLVKHGGHPQAAGLSLRPEAFEAFREDLRAYAREALRPEDLTPRLAIDQVLAAGEIGWELVEDLDRMAPFGVGNPSPLFVVEGLRVDSVQVMGRTGTHVRLGARELPEGVESVGFHLRDLVEETLEPPGSVDLAFRLSRNRFRGRERIQLRLEDLRPATSASPPAASLA